MLTTQDRSFLRIKWLQTARRWKRLNLDSILRSSGFFLLVGFFWVLCYQVVSRLCSTIYQYDVIGPLVLERIVSFGFLAALIIVSVGQILTAYSALFRGLGLPQLVTSPYPMHRLYRIQCLETLFLGGWVSGLFCIPIILAYGWELNAAWWYYPVVMAGLACFLMTAGMFGVLVMLFVARWILGRPWRTAFGAVLVIVLFFFVVLYTSLANRDLAGEHRLSTHRRSLGQSETVFVSLLAQPLDVATDAGGARR